MKQREGRWVSGWEGGERGSYQSNGLLLMGKWGVERKGGDYLEVEWMDVWLYGCVVAKVGRIVWQGGRFVVFGRE